jgi:16S rRNA (uracil1498-N3)-methyltransferase
MTNAHPMYRHFIETDRLGTAPIALAREESRHLRTVLRIRDGETVELFDGRGTTLRATVGAIDRHTLRLNPIDAPVRHQPPACALTLFACVSKGKRMDWTVEKAAELGVSRIVPVLSSRTIVQLDDDSAECRADRWTRVAIDATRQSGGAWVPRIDTPRALTDLQALVQFCAPVFVAALTPGAMPMRQALAEFRARAAIPAAAGWFVGPEGDFTIEELQILLHAGAIPVNLGRQILRTETAAIWGLCVLGAEWL